MKLISLLTNRIIVFLAASRIHPNHVTLVGLLFVVIGTYYIVNRLWLMAFASILIGTLCDYMDGKLARHCEMSSKSGALLDSALDRVSDCFILAGILLYFINIDNQFMVYVALIAIIGSFEVSYIKARSEGLLQECPWGFWERPERLVVLLTGILFQNIEVSVILLAGGSIVTSYQRLVRSMAMLSGRSSDMSLAVSKNRKSINYAIKLGIIIALIIFFKNH